MPIVKLIRVWRPLVSAFEMVALPESPPLGAHDAMTGLVNESVLTPLLTEAMGPDWISTSLIGAISLEGGVPQALHQDQGIWSDSRPMTSADCNWTSAVI